MFAIQYDDEFGVIQKVSSK